MILKYTESNKWGKAKGLLVTPYSIGETNTGTLPPALVFLFQERC